MRILLTNVTLASRTGTEINIRDIALGLLRRGHQPVVYSPHLGEMADEIRAATVPVVDDLTRIAAPPDVIHGHHHTSTMTALLRFPGVPALFFVHDWAAWTDEPLRFPRVQLYVPVDATNRDQLELEHGIPRERIRLLLNAVDLERFAPRPPLPARPRRALVFSNYAAEGDHLAALREACAGAGIELAVVGSGVGNSAVRPEAVLPDFDLVFAKGRAALEALAVGCAVVLCDVRGLGEMVSSAELPRLRALNLGRRALQRPVTAAALAAEIARYDAADAAAVSSSIRAEAGLERQLDRLLGLYEEAIRFAAAAPDDPAHEGEAAAAYLQRWLPRFGPPAARPAVRGVVVLYAHEVDALQRAAAAGEAARRRAEQADAEAASLRPRTEESEAEVAALRQHAEAAEGEVEALRRRVEQADAGVAAAGATLERAAQEAAEARAEISSLRAELSWITATLTWRLRSALLRPAAVRRLYRRLRNLS